MPTYYLHIEGVNLTNFVDDTEDLSTVRGGSLLLLDVVRRSRMILHPLKLKEISSGASAGLFQFEAKDVDTAQTILQKLEKELHNDSELKHATFVVNIIPETNDFARDREALTALNRWQQMRQPRLAIPQWNTGHKSHGSSCQVDRVRPANDFLYREEGKKDNVSASVKVRAEYGRKKKQDFYELETGQKIDRKFAYDFDELTKLNTPHSLHHKMAVIYLDGNNFGNIQRSNCPAIGDLEEFDHTVKGYRRKALSTLLNTMLNGISWISTEGRYRLEILLWGGDEVILVVPAWQGWKTLALFYQESKDLMFHSTPLTHGGGLVFCHHNAPIHRITKLAKNLASQAKNLSRKQNLFAYEILESFDHPATELDNIRQKRLPINAYPNSLILPGEGMNSVIAAFESVNRVLPRRQIYRIGDQLRYDPAKADELIKGAIGELSKSPGWGQITKYFENTGNTMWVHLAELWDYLVEDVNE